MLPTPNLDDRTFQEIVYDLKRQIGRRCPEWTDHNVSDPGVTLIELFAWLTEMTLYRLNQVPEKNYIKFLEMLGMRLEAPTPAETELLFELSRPIADADGEEAFEVTLPARRTVAATIRTETEEAIEFATDADLRMVRPRLAFVMATSHLDDSDTSLNAREFKSGTFSIFEAVPRQGNALYLGFSNDVSGNVVEFDVNCVPAAATGLDESYPSQLWEVWSGAENRWNPLSVVEDTTTGFNTPGSIRVAMPHGLMTRSLGGRRGIWVRARYTTDPADLPPRGIQMLRPSVYQRSPEITGLAARVVGGIAPASNSVTVWNHTLGLSDGTPGQVFELPHAPLLVRRTGEVILVGEQDVPIAEHKAWKEVADFSESRPNDHHFVCDSLSGEIFFGPNVLQPDGSTTQHGAVPPKGAMISFSVYRYGGGTHGNVKENQVRVLKSSIPYIAGVTNPGRADGGRDAETMQRAKLRGQAILRARERAVTSEDYEFLARRASSGVGRARCVQPNAIHDSGARGEHVPPGVVRVLVVPQLASDVLIPHPADLRVRDEVLEEVRTFLDERRLLTAVLEVGEPEYLFVSTDITLIADPRAEPDVVARSVQERLARYIHPLTGGPSGEGWPFRRTLTLADVYAQVQAASGVAFLLEAEIAVSRIINKVDHLLGTEQIINKAEGIRPGDNELLCTREHRIIVRPMWSLGAEDNSQNRQNGSSNRSTNGYSAKGSTNGTANGASYGSRQ